jgi:hypothetical protein
LGGKSNEYRLLMGKPEINRPLGRYKHRWKGEIKIDFRKIRWGYRLDSSGTGYRPVANSCEHANELLG